jgi:hypothetical protein
MWVLRLDNRDIRFEDESKIGIEKDRIKKGSDKDENINHL